MSRVERFSQRARRILAVAQEEADSLRNSAIETPHILLAMLRVEDSIAYRVLHDLKIDYDRVLPVVQSANPAEPTPPETHELAPETKRLMETAMQIARQRGDPYIGSEHILLSLIKGEDKSIRYLIRQINLEPAVVRSCIERVLQQDKSDLPSTQPFNESGAVEIDAAPQSSSEPNARTKVLQMVDSGKITAAEAADLLKAMRFAAVPTLGTTGFVLLPLDEVNFDDLRQRSLRFVVIEKSTNIVKSEVVLPFDQAQNEIFRLLRDIYNGTQGTLIDLEGDQDHLQISLY